MASSHVEWHGTLHINNSIRIQYSKIPKHANLNAYFMT